MIAHYARSAAWLALAATIGFLVYLALFAAGLASGIPILFYRGIALAIPAALLAGIALALIARGRVDPSLPVAAAAVAFAFNICFLVLFPVTVDRSVTVYLLSTVERHDRTGLSAAELERAFLDGYVSDMRAVPRRIAEQQQSGNISVAPDGRIQLTPQGRRFMALSRTIADMFGTDRRFVGGAAGPERAAAP